MPSYGNNFKNCKYDNIEMVDEYKYLVFKILIFDPN